MCRLAKLGDFTNPLSGNKGSVTDIKGLWSLVLGAGVLFVIFNLGQKLAYAVTGKLPGGIRPGLDRPIVETPSSAPTRRIYGAA